MSPIDDEAKKIIRSILNISARNGLTIQELRGKYEKCEQAFQYFRQFFLEALKHSIMINYIQLFGIFRQFEGQYREEAGHSLGMNDNEAREIVRQVPGAYIDGKRSRWFLKADNMGHIAKFILQNPRKSRRPKQARRHEPFNARLEGRPQSFRSQPNTNVRYPLPSLLDDFDSSFLPRPNDAMRARSGTRAQYESSRFNNSARRYISHIFLVHFE